MIVNLDGVVDSLVNWINTKRTEASAESLVVGLSGGADSALVAILCKRTGAPTYAVMMPCNSSPSSLERATELATQFDISTLTVDLESAFTSISTQAANGEEVSDTASSALRSCLRTPTLDFVAKMHNGIIVGTGNRDEDELTRYYQKRGDGSVDISPIAKLHKSEVYQLLVHLNAPQSIIDAPPSADLLGPDSGQTDEESLGMTYEEIEWGTKQYDTLKNVVDFSTLSTTMAAWSPRELEVYNTLMLMEKNTRHKVGPVPVFDIRLILGLFE